MTHVRLRPGVRRWPAVPLSAGAFLLLAVLAAPARAGEGPGPSFQRGPVDRLAVPRGPVELRDEYMLAQPRMTLPATSPDLVPCGTWDLSVLWVWGSDFGFSQFGPAEDPRSDRRFLVDGEHHTVALTATRGLRPGLDVALRLPVQWRGAGVLDPFIDWFHDITHTLDNARPEFNSNQYRVEGRDASFHRFDWDDEKGLGLGNAEVAVRWAPPWARSPRALRAALVGRLGLPTGTGPFETGSVDVGVQAVVGRRLARRFDLYGGAGATCFSQTNVRGFGYERLRAQGFLALEYRPLRWVSLTLQTDLASRLVSNVVDFPSLQWYLHGGAKIDLDGRSHLVVGITENLQDQQSTADVNLWLGLETRF